MSSTQYRPDDSGHIKVLSVFSREVVEIKTLSRFQKFICRLFRITPAKKFDVLLEMRVRGIEIRKGDVVMIAGYEHTGYVHHVNTVGMYSKKQYQDIKVRVSRADYAPGIITDLIVIGNAFVEH